MIISEQMATSASLPNPSRNCAGSSVTPSTSYGNTWKPDTSTIMTARLEDSSGNRSRVNRISAVIIKTTTAIPWASGVIVSVVMS